MFKMIRNKHSFQILFCILFLINVNCSEEIDNNTSKQPEKDNTENITESLIQRVYVGSRTFNGLTGYADIDSGESINLGADFTTGYDIDYEYSIISFSDCETSGCFTDSTSAVPNGIIYESPVVSISSSKYIELHTDNKSNRNHFTNATITINISPAPSNNSGPSCCSQSNPCNWGNDGICDCNGQYSSSWDYADCHKSTTPVETSKCNDSCTSNSDCPSGAYCCSDCDRTYYRICLPNLCTSCTSDGYGCLADDDCQQVLCFGK